MAAYPEACIAGAPLGRSTQPAASPVQSAQADLDDCTSSLHNMIEELEARLRPVLAPANEAAGKEASPQPIPNSVASCIKSSARSVREAVGRLNAIRDRLEV